MFGISGTEFLVIAVIALICVGPKQMPMLFRQLGRFYRQVRRFICLYRTAIDDALYDADVLADKAEKMLNSRNEKNDGKS